MNPSPNLRVVVDFSRTSLGVGRTMLPERAIVVGDEDYRLPFVGAGSARVVSPVIKPEYYEGQAYLTIDFGDQARVINKLKTGLMRWYGVQFALDDRRLIGFTRDISVVTDEEYRAMQRPTKISRFPEDLLQYKGLEYSGLYEDGWTGTGRLFQARSLARRPGALLQGVHPGHRRASAGKASTPRSRSTSGLPRW